MRDWASGGGAKIERAKEHVQDFALASRAFLEAHRYSAVSQFDAQSREIDSVVQGSHAVPPRLACIAADAAHNLHASLDILWRQVWATNRRYFPCTEETHELKARFKSVKETSQHIAVDILFAAKADQARNKTLRALHELDTRDKHEVPILAAAVYKKIVMRAPPDVALDGRTGLTFVGEIASGFVFLEHGAHLPLALRIETDAGPVMDMECELTPDIAFAKGEILEGKPVLETLHEFAQLVDGIARAFVKAGLLAVVLAPLTPSVLHTLGVSSILLP